MAFLLAVDGFWVVSGFLGLDLVGLCVLWVLGSLWVGGFSVGVWMAFGVFVCVASELC